MWCGCFGEGKLEFRRWRLGFEEVVVVYVGLGGVGETTSSRHWGVDASLDGLEEGASV